MKKKMSTSKANKLLAKLMKQGDDLESAMAKMRKKGIAPMEVVISLTKVLGMSIEEADKSLLNSIAYGDLKKETLQLRDMAHGIFMDEADEIIQEPNGKIMLKFDLDKED